MPVATPVVVLPLPGEAISDAEKWNNDWEALLRRSILTPEFCFSDMINDNRLIGNDNASTQYHHQLAGTCELQFHLTAEAQLYFSTKDLETRWLAATPDIRRKHLIGALADVCSKSQNLNKARAYCAPELRLSRLRLSGQVFLDLLRSAMLEDGSCIPRKPRYIAHPKWDDFEAEQGARNRTSEEQLALAEVLLLRTKLICYVLRFALRSFLDLAPPHFMVHKDRKPPSDPMRFAHREIEKTLFGPQAAKERRKHEIASTKERITQRVVSCSYLGCSNCEPADGSIKFRKCTRCYEKMERQVLYCSSKCQRADWKSRHRAMCGKPLTFDDVATLPDHPINAALRALNA